MKLIIAGSRSIDLLPHRIAEIMSELGVKLPDMVVSGGARGIDGSGEAWARARFIDVYVMSADWELYGKIAGIKRNQRMAHYADELLLIWDGESRGSRHMKNEMQRLGKPIHEKIIK